MRGFYLKGILWVSPPPPCMKHLGVVIQFFFFLILDPKLFLFHISSFAPCSFSFSYLFSLSPFLFHINSSYPSILVSMLSQTTEETRLALEMLIQSKVAAALPVRAADKLQPTQYIRYTPSAQATSYNSGAKQRIIKIVEAQKDPMEPHKFKTNTKIPRGPPSPPAPVLHSPTRKVSVKEQQEWKIPPCISNWKNPKVSASFSVNFCGCVGVCVRGWVCAPCRMCVSCHIVCLFLIYTDTHTHTQTNTHTHTKNHRGYVEQTQKANQ